jgi:hypothetical protein
MSTKWFSTNRNGNVEMFTDLNGRPTSSRPHVHTICHEKTKVVELVATTSDGQHIAKESLRDPDGNEVNRAQARLADVLRKHQAKQTT